MRILQRSVLLPFSLAALLPTVTLLAQSRTAADLLPATTIAYAEIGEPGKLFDLAVNHPLRKQVEATSQYKQYIGSKQYRQLLLVLLLAENQLGMK